MQENTTNPVRYDRNTCIVRLQGSVNNQEIFRICDEVDLAISYYNYRDISIEIDSYGGSILSLDYYMNKLSEWRSRGVSINTSALTAATSAAVYILCLGDVFRRTAYPSSRIAFHYGYVNAKDDQFNERELVSHATRLREIDDRFIDRVSESIVSSIIKYNAKSFPHFFDDKDRAAITKEMNEIGIGIMEISDPSSVIAKLDEIKDIVTRLHSIDQPLTPLIARSLLLIDNIKGLKNG